jgi:ketosteroid isomerase-like protein
MQDVANRIVDLVNSQDAAGLTAMLAEGAVYLDEDGHAIPATAWAGRITAGDPPRNLSISGMRGETWDNSGWVSFNYELTENHDGNPVTLRGTASIVLQQVGGNWMIRAFHGAMYQTVAGLVAGE